VKGKKQPITIYELLGEGPPEDKLARFLKSYAEGLALLRDRQWTKSLEAFRAAHDHQPHDHLCSHYLQVAQKLLQTPPGPEWDGVTTMGEK
jgi:adenylate cyclase